jgi:hypothetical protein
MSQFPQSLHISQFRNLKLIKEDEVGRMYVYTYRMYIKFGQKAEEARLHGRLSI